MKPFRKLNTRQKHRAFKLLLSPVSATFALRNMLSSRGVRELRNQIANEAAEDHRQRTKTRDKNNKIKRLRRKHRGAKT